MSEAVEPINVPEESTSLADHEQDFGRPSGAPSAPAVEAVPDADDDDASSERDATGRFAPRKHKAVSQRATPADVEAINQYTKRIREAEDKLGLTVERKEGESDRVYNLRRRAELAEARANARAEPKAPDVPPLPRREPPKPFDEKEPQYEDFANEPDQYQAHLRALTAWDRRREAAEQQGASHKSEMETAIKARNEARDRWFAEQYNAHNARMAEFHKSNPEAQAILDASDAPLTQAMYAAIVTAENSPQLLMRLAQDQDLVDDLTILTQGKPLNKELVALVQRRLNRGLQAASTGSATPLPKPTILAVPRPPNPVRTGPMKSADTPPSDEDGLAAHEKFYGRKR